MFTKLSLVIAVIIALGFSAYATAVESAHQPCLELGIQVLAVP